jgi:hypothetical protein
VVSAAVQADFMTGGLGSSDRFRMVSANGWIPQQGRQEIPRPKFLKIG